MTRTLAVIPARYAAQRFPGKPLALLWGKPMLRHVWERAREAAGLDAIVVATDDARIAAISDRTRNGGAEIVKLLKTGSAYYAPAMSAVEMVEAILTDQKRLVPCSVLLQGEYGMRDIFLGVPIVLGGKGVEKIVELKLTAEESAALQKSGKDVESSIAELSVAV